MQPRVLLLSALLCFGCQVWPQDRVPCRDSGRCEPVGFVLGQPDAFTNHLPGGMVNPRGILSLGTRLYVADCVNHRVLIWENLPTRNHEPPDRVLGQPNLTTNTPNHGGVSARSLNCPTSLASDGTRLLVADRDNHRVLIWNTIPLADFQPADVVVGQRTMTSSDVNGGGAVSAFGFNTPSVSLSGSTSDKRMYVAEEQNHRVLIFDSIPTSNFAGAGGVLGQPSFTTNVANNGGVSGASMNRPRAVWSTGDKLLVADWQNNRVLVWNTLPSGMGQAANVVLGQTALNLRMQNGGSGAPAASTLYGPSDVFATATQLIVSDEFNSRVLIFSGGIPTINAAPATFAIGQPDLNSNAITAPTATSLVAPTTVYPVGSNLLISDSANHRALLFNQIPSTSGAAASLVLGQPDFTSNLLNNPGVVSVDRQNGTNSLSRSGSRFLVCEQESSRITLWDRIPQGPADRPSVVLGQPDFGTGAANTGGPSARSLNRPSGLHSDGTRLAVSDAANNRVLLFHAVPTQSHQPADLVLGQADMTGALANRAMAMPAADTLANPSSVFLDGQRLIVSEVNNNRVLIWSRYPTTNGQPADLVLGQADMMSNAANRGGAPSAVTLNGPNFASSDGTRLYVSDRLNHRVLIWNQFPTQNGQAADLVLGQTGPLMVELNRPTTAATLREPRSIYVHMGRLYVADRLNNRVLYWNSIPTQNGQAADGVVGQPNLNSSLGNDDGISLSTLLSPAGILATPDVLFIADAGNGRVVAVGTPP